MIGFTTTNNASGLLLSSLGASGTTIILQTGQGALFPNTYPFYPTVEKIVGGVVTQREIVKCTNKTGDNLTVVRSAGTCPPNDSSNTPGTTAFAFDAGDRVSLYTPAELFQDLYTGIREKLDLSGGTLTGAVNEQKGADIASASTVDLATATGNYVSITGTTTITSLGTVPAGGRYTLDFTGILTLTYNATSLKLPSQANIVTQVGDKAVFRSEGGGNWDCESYTRANGTALVSSDKPTTRITFIAGEDITAGNALRNGALINNTYNIPQSNYSNNYGFGNSQYKWGQEILTNTTDLVLQSLTIKLAKVNSPTDNIVIKCYLSDKTTLIATSSIISGSSLTISPLDYTFYFSNITLLPNTLYFFEISRSTTDTTNYYTIYVGNSDSLYANGHGYSYNGSIWSIIYDLYFNIIFGNNLEDTSKLYKTNASNSYKINFIGFATNTISAGGNVMVDTSGVSATQTGLTIGSDYYLSDTSGAISTSAGTNSKKCGKSISTTGILVNTFA